MMPVNFTGSVNINKPADMTDEQCSPLPVLMGVDEDRMPFILSCWQPSKEDLEAIQAGRPIWLKVFGMQMPPVFLWTMDAQENPNI